MAKKNLQKKEAEDRKEVSKATGKRTMAEKAGVGKTSGERTMAEKAGVGKPSENGTKAGKAETAKASKNETKGGTGKTSGDKAGAEKAKNWKVDFIMGIVIAVIGVPFFVTEYRIAGIVMVVIGAFCVVSGICQKVAGGGKE